MLAYLMSRANMPLEEAFRFVQSKRKEVRPNAGFVEQLKQYEDMLKQQPEPAASDSVL